ncbi:MAG: rhodanese-like domain-containing protein [Cytophagia bacterium]|nr:rhodanese-like domain-containing protein [Cytophagia bacterium]
MSKKLSLLLISGLALFLFAFGIYVFQNGFFSFWDSDVKRIDTEEAKQLLTETSPILIDARAPEEFEVSHLKGSMLFEDGVLERLDKTQPIVIYCTIGVRSNRVAKQISDQGFDVYDMKDGILGWANGDLPIIDSEGQPTDRVHTYNKSFAHLLKKGTAVY